MAKRNKTKYPGVIFTYAPSRIKKGKREKVYYIYARVNGRLVEEKVGRQWEDQMTPAKANNHLADRRAGRIKNPHERRAEEKAAKLAEQNRYTITRLWESYKENRSIKGIGTDENRFKNHIEPVFGNKEPKDIVSLDVDRLRIKLLKKRSPATVRNVLELLRRIINYGVKKNLSDSLSFTIEMPKVSNLRTETLTEGQLAYLLETIHNSENVIAGAMMKMALFTGIRRGEMFRLKWEHIDEERGFIRLVDPKGGTDQEIPMNDGARDLLGDLPQDSDFVFPGRKGKQRVDINKAVAEIKADAGLPKDFRALHGLRHVFASLLASSGEVDLYTIQKLLTHKSPNMTMRYAHLRDEALKKASDLVGDIVNSSVKRLEKVVGIKE